MTFRTARASDAPILAALSIEVWMGTYIRHGVNALFAEYALNTFTSARMTALLTDPAEHVIVSENRDGLDGFVRISRESAAPVAEATGVELSTLYVQPCHQGRGLGQALLDQAVQYARAIPAGSIWLTTNSDNAPAIAFYLSQGFEKIGTTQVRIGDQAYPNDVFRRVIPQ